MQRYNKCLQKFLLLFLVSFSLLSLQAPSYSANGECSEEKILQSKAFQVCLSQLESCNKGFEKLEKQLADSHRDKVLFFIDAENLGYFAIGLLVGVIL